MDTGGIRDKGREMDTGDIRDKGRELDTGGIRDKGREMDTGDIRDNGREMDTGDIRDNDKEMDTGDIRDNGRELDTGDIRDNDKEMDTGDIRDKGRELDTGDIRDKGREMETGDIRDKGRELDTGDIRDKGRELDTGDIRDKGREMQTGDIRDKGREMETGDISDSHMEMACEKAAVEHQWEVVLQLLCDGVSPAEWIISELFENMTPQLLSCFSPSKVHSSVRGPLLQSAILFGRGDFLLQILHHETVPDRQLMDTIMFAVHLRQGDVLLQLFRFHSRSRRVFRQFFPNDPQSDDEEIRWIFNCLDEGGEKDLALDIATCAKASLVADFFRSNIADISMKKPKFRRALSHLYAFCNKEFHGVVTELKARSHYDRRHIFWFALGQGDFHLAAEVCGPGIRREDLKLALPLILNERCVELVSKFIRNAQPLFGRGSCVQLATQCALERLSVHKTETDLRLFLALYKMNKGNTFCPSFRPVQAKIMIKAVWLVIQSGAVSFRVLDELRHDSWKMKSWQKQCYTVIGEAAATPSRLQHLARLTVSDAIGCHPGRPARIDSLPIAERLKDLINFQDVIEQNAEDITE